MKRFNPIVLTAPPPPPAAEPTPSATHEPEATPARKRLTIGSRLNHSRIGASVVVAIHGEQRPETIQNLGGGVATSGGNAEVDVILSNGSYVHRIPEAILHSLPWHIEDDAASADEVKALIAKADTLIAERTAKQEKEKADRVAERQRIIAENPHLDPNTRGEPKDGASNLRKELARAFPGVKFSVRTSHASMTNSIDVRWTLGPTVKQVDDIAGKYQQGHFDGMTDSYEYSHAVWTQVFGGAKYVHSQRDVPGNIHQAVAEALCALQKVAMDGDRTRLLGDNDSYSLWDHVHQVLCRTSWPVGATFKGVEHVEWTPEAQDHHWCRIVLDVPNAAATSQAGVLCSSRGVSLTRNTERELLELRFPGKPEDALRFEMKAAKWRWFGPAGCWYHRDNPDNLAWAERFIEKHFPSAPQTTPVPAAVTVASAPVPPQAPDNIVQMPMAQPQPQAEPAADSIPAWRKRLSRSVAIAVPTHE